VIANRYDAEIAASLEIAPECGVFLVFFTLFIVIWCDAGAYFGGRAYGKHKLAPAISPKKTIEGAIAGVLSAVLAAGICKGLFELLWPTLSAPVSWFTAGVLALLLSIAGIIGDLIESLLKRDAQVKDTGSLFPGHGGVLDRMDSLLLAIPVMYYAMLFYVYIQVG
jgi:phosphatidate cytidylyltransferase